MATPPKPALESQSWDQESSLKKVVITRTLGHILLFAGQGCPPTNMDWLTAICCLVVCHQRCELWFEELGRSHQRQTPYLRLHNHGLHVHTWMCLPVTKDTGPYLERSKGVGLALLFLVLTPACMYRHLCHPIVTCCVLPLPGSRGEIKTRVKQTVHTQIITAISW